MLSFSSLLKAALPIKKNCIDSLVLIFYIITANTHKISQTLSILRLVIFVLFFVSTLILNTTVYWPEMTNQHKV